MSYNAATAAGAAPVPGSSKKHFETILAGRKCYRMSKEKNEVVWPPHLEQALMEGLEKYSPAESKSPRGLTRFPNRNKFISEYILKKTGEIRSAKQVGSRIQQLRDTSAGKTIMKAISDRHYEMMHPTRHSEPAQDMGMSDVYFNGTMVPPMNQVIHVYISVPLASASASASAPWAETYAQTSRHTEVNVLSSSAYSWGEPRPLRTIDPTVTFTSPAPMTLYSSFTVYCGSTVVHIDHPKPMRTRSTEDFGSTSSACACMHYTTLAPGYWDNLCACADLSPYIIVQEITKQPADLAQKPIAVMLIHYHFNATSAPPLSPFALNEDDLEAVDYETDEMCASGLPLPPHASAMSAAVAAHALSTSSESPYPSDRSSSPSYSIPAGFCSQPLSPVDWTQGQGQGQGPAWALGALSAHQQQQQHQQQHQQIPMTLPALSTSSASSSPELSAAVYAGAYGIPQQHQHQQHQHQHQHQYQPSRGYVGAHAAF